MKEFEYENYKMTTVYHDGNRDMKKAIDDYGKKNHLNNNQMYLQLRRYDLEHLPKKEKNAPSGMATIIIFVIVVASVLLMRFINNFWLLLADTILMVFLSIGLFTGLFSQTKAEIRQIENELKKYPSVEKFKGLDK